MRAVAVFVFFVILRVFVMIEAAEQAPTAAELKAKLEHRIQDIAARVDGVVGYEVRDLTSGERFGHLERAVFPTASAIKLAIVYELFKQADEGRVRFDDALTLDRKNAVGGSGGCSSSGRRPCRFATMRH